MALADNTPLVNGQAYSYADIVVSIAGVPLAGIMEISYKDSQEVTENFGAGRFPVSRGKGKIESEASISIDRAEYNAIINAAPGKRLQNIPEFDITVSYVPEASAPVTDIIRNCVFKNGSGGAAEGDSNVVAELELAVSHIDYNN
tara:strand:- start:6114 stop:6548 length:435 start_codon:yes stop_codon:yes gene_type:complete